MTEMRVFHSPRKPYAVAPLPTTRPHAGGERRGEATFTAARA
jgi:hypothetical protein